jgi:murein DD-endopeptidase MepM/ murein hydrolase activator NlpD
VETLQLTARRSLSALSLIGAAACGPALRPLPPIEPVRVPPAASTEPAPAPSAPSDGRYPFAGEAPRLMVPVEGVVPSRIADSFRAPREKGIHGAVDILAPRGTPVLAADSGTIMRMRSNPLGGITIYALDHTERFVFYYAHLDRYRSDLAEGMRVAMGEVLGYVGTTGNAPPDTPHLHFQVMVRREDARYWDGTPIDPRPFFERPGQQR